MSRKVSQIIAPTASAMPSGTSGFGPNLGASAFCVTIEEKIMQATIGRNATPVCTGENARICCK